MAYSITFAGLTAPVMSYLDINFTQVGNLGIIPCAVTGTDALVLTPVAGRTPTITAYFDGLQVAGTAVATNTTAMTARVGALAVLSIYKDSPSGPVACSGGEVINTCAFSLRYNSALNSGAGGWHLCSNTAYAGGTLAGRNLILVDSVSGSVTTTATLAAPYGSLTSLKVGASAAAVTRVLSTLATITFTVVPANTNQLQTLACPGAQVNDAVQVGPPASVVAGTSFQGHVLAAGTLGITAINSTAASLTPTVGLYRLVVTGFT